MSYERRIYQHIIPALGGIQLDKLTTAGNQEFYSSLKKSGRLIRAELYCKGLSDQTVCGIHTTLHAALDGAVEENLIVRNPSEECKLPSVKPREMNVLTPEDIQRVRDKLVVSPPKTKAGRHTVLLTPPVLNTLKAYKIVSTP